MKEELRWLQDVPSRQNNTCRPNENMAVADKIVSRDEGTASSQTTQTEKNHKVSTMTVRRGDVLEHVNTISRYANDFEEIEEIGRGGFGVVFKAKHLLDENIYAIKKIKLRQGQNQDENKRILREINHLSRLNNQFIVRYFQTWIERETNGDVIGQFSATESEEEAVVTKPSLEPTENAAVAQRHKDVTKE